MTKPKVQLRGRPKGKAVAGRSDEPYRRNIVAFCKRQFEKDFGHKWNPYSREGLGLKPSFSDEEPNEDDDVRYRARRRAAEVRFEGHRTDLARAYRRFRAAAVRFHDLVKELSDIFDVTPDGNGWNEVEELGLLFYMPVVDGLHPSIFLDATPESRESEHRRIVERAPRLLPTPIGGVWTERHFAVVGILSGLRPKPKRAREKQPRKAQAGSEPKTPIDDTVGAVYLRECRAYRRLLKK